MGTINIDLSTYPCPERVDTDFSETGIILDALRMYVNHCREVRCDYIGEQSMKKAAGVAQGVIARLSAAVSWAEHGTVIHIDISGTNHRITALFGHRVTGDSFMYVPKEDLRAYDVDGICHDCRGVVQKVKAGITLEAARAEVRGAS